MNGFEMLENDKRAMIDDGFFSTDCILYSPDNKVQGLGATLPKDDPNYNADDKLRCFSPYIGLDISTETGMAAFAKSAEITINMSSVKIGEIKQGWLIDIYFPSVKKWIKFKCEHIAPDLLIGNYLIKPSLVEKKITNSSDLRIGGLQ